MRPAALQNFIDTFSELPGIGPRSAERVGYTLVLERPELILKLMEGLQGLTTGIKTCSQCGNLSAEDPCEICSSPNRDPSLICVVETPQDIPAIESTDVFQGLFHVLGGVISPLHGTTPADLKIEALVERVRKGGISEVILALSPTMEGDTTSMYLTEVLEESKVKISRLARGIPFGSHLQFVGSSSLRQAFESRK